MLIINSVELFSGAGGLAIGVSKAGFCHKAVIQRDKNACETIRENQRRGVKAIAN
jgi:DNA (cytosine-5)-methyltransferase 1